MADIFISYAREDREWVSRLAAIFVAEGYTVWWDFDLLVGKRYRETIEAELQDCKATVVVWSEHSTKSDFVRDEAEEGQQRNVLLPVLKTQVRPPAGFRQLQTADLSSWSGDPNHPEFRRMMKGVAYLVGREPKSEQRDAGPYPAPGPAPVAAETPAAAPQPVEAHPAPLPHPAETPKPAAFVAAPVHNPVIAPPAAAAPASNRRWIAIGAGAAILVLVLYGLRAMFAPGPAKPTAPAAATPSATATPAPAPPPASPKPPHQGSATVPAPAATPAGSDEGQQGQHGGGTGSSRPAETTPSGGDATGDTEGSQQRH